MWHVCMRRENVERGCGGVGGQVCDGRIKKSRGRAGEAGRLSERN